MSSAALAISVEGLTKVLGRKQVLTELRLEVPQGAIYGLVGRNGAGKTTLMRCLTGLALPDKGRALVRGKPLAWASHDEKRKLGVGFLPELSMLPSWMRAQDCVQFERAASVRWNGERLDRFLLEERIEKRRLVKDLSKGQRRRFELELVLAAQPSVLVLDEPFDGFDPIARAGAMSALMAHVAEESCTVLICSHLLGELERMCDRIGILFGGKIAFESELDELRETMSRVQGDPRVLAGFAERVHLVARHEGLDASEPSIWLVKNLHASVRDELERNGLQVTHPGVQELGLDLLRCFSARTTEEER